MHLSVQLCGLLLYALVSAVSSQEKDRLWHSTTPGPSASVVDPPTTPGVPSVENIPLAAEPAGQTGPVVPPEVVRPTEPPTPLPGSGGGVPTAQDVLTVEAAEGKRQEAAGVKEKKERKWISAPKEEKKEEAPVKLELQAEKTDKKWMSEQKDVKEDKAKEIEKAKKAEKKDRKWISAPVNEEVKAPEGEKNIEPEQEKIELEVVTESVEESQNISSEVSSEEVKPKKKKKYPKYPRKWVSVPGMALDEEPPAPPTEEDFSAAKESLDIAQQTLVEEPLKSSERLPENIDMYALNPLDTELQANITELLMAAEEGIPMVQETIISKKTTIYVTISDTIDAEPLFVNLTGIRHYTGHERRMMSGCLDLSDLMLTGEDIKEVIQRMSKHKFHRLDLSNNNVTEFPANTFSPVAFTVRELRLDGNPLASNEQGEASVLQRGGLFHLTELRELNLSGCGLQDMDYFTPWNSNHLEVVDLSNNKLPVVPTNLQFFHKLKKLYLDGNPIRGVSELPFALLWNMQVLSLADCQVATITDDPFRNMDKLKELSLEGNNLTQIGHVRLPRTNSAVKLFLSGNPWHCACEMLNFIEHYHYAIRDIEYIRCASPRWLEGLRTAYLTKEILSLDAVDGDCAPHSPLVSGTRVPLPVYPPTLRADRLQLLALVVFVMAALCMLCHVLRSRKRGKFRFDDDQDDIHYIRIEKKPNFK